MLLKRIINGLVIALLCVFLNACVSSGKPKIQKSNKEQADIYLQMGVRYMELNMLETAKEKLDTALDLDSNNEAIYNALGVMYERLNQYSIAGVHYKEAMSINASNFSIKNNYGRFLCERGQYQQGLNLLKEALAMPLNNRRWFAYTNIGRCELKNEKQAVAELNFRQALLENSQFSPALIEMQKMSYKKGEFLSSRAFLERYLSVAKHTAGTLWYGVQTERALGNKSLVEQYQTQLFSLFPASKEAIQLKNKL